MQLQRNYNTNAITMQLQYTYNTNAVTMQLQYTYNDLQWEGYKKVKRKKKYPNKNFTAECKHYDKKNDYRFW